MESLFKLMITCALHFLPKIVCQSGIQDVNSLCKKDSKTNTAAILTLKNIGFSGCGKFCVSYGGCIGFSYHLGNLECVLTDDAVSHEPAEGWLFCGDLNWVKEQMGSCANNIPAPGSRCCELRGGQKKNVVVSCLDTPTVNNGLISMVNRSVGATAPLQCKTGYVGTGATYVSCKSDGRWTPVTLICKDCGPPPSPSFTSRSYTNTLVGGQATYSCYTGYVNVESSGVVKSTCQSSGSWSTPSITCINFKWPGGKYAMLQPKSGCPSYFDSGYISFPLELGHLSSTSSSQLKGTFSSSSIGWYFCSNTYDVPGKTWPAGDYCIMIQTSTCPTGFTQQHLHIKTKGTRVQSGPGKLYASGSSTETIVYFCCRSDGNVASSIDLPTENQFILFRFVAKSCQSVTGVTPVLYNTLFDDTATTSRTYFHHDNSGLVNYDRSKMTIQLFFCYYT